ncbi:MAG: threonylcarbamoyl-AMP synthase [Candidatus Harrisonbacteria bacterium CG10_big_fil_rev_8_21_14_0_10_45_28]|uniref:L-threonylcarbamoyladenylate synthase n=1 Tax=Candidatus Harrisonbacteria bacterium CG10_big_fil_rev_8_21_14_0_10_45_28 TaxID=1974586 RepID=A0A2H0UMH6_9BACT|nr:MAG: threonylcarbamoyl-AMP synthase [Candidatus Harrisonbacteria bacterium CG10_big_fil_rev_8_21_14_0_10_45_28]
MDKDITQEQVVNILKNGGVGILATDTIYGLVGSALNKQTVSRILKIKERAPEKTFIVLINSLDELALFGVEMNKEIEKTLKRFWPGKVSVVLPISPSAGYNKYFYLHQGKQELAFRLPAKPMLRAILRKTGPLVAPSANPTGKIPATNIKEAEAYFGDQIDFYYSGKASRATKVSTLIRFDKYNLVELIRPGAVRIPKELLS